MILDHVGWVTNNVEKFEHFWCTGLGFQKVWEAIINPEKIKALFGLDCGATAIRYKKDTMIIEVHVFSPPVVEVSPSFNVFGINHIGLWVEDREALIAELQKNLGYVEVKRFWDKSGWWNIFIRDYEGNWIELRTTL